MVYGGHHVLPQQRMKTALDRVGGSGCELEDFNFGAILNGGLGAIQNVSRNLLGKVVFAAVFADLGRHPFENDCRLTPLERGHDLARAGFTLPADNTFHDNLLVRKSGCQMAWSGR